MTGAVAVANPPSADEPYLRRSLIPNLLQALARTMARGARSVAPVRDRSRVPPIGSRSTSARSWRRRSPASPMRGSVQRVEVVRLLRREGSARGAPVRARDRRLAARRHLGTTPASRPGPRRVEIGGGAGGRDRRAPPARRGAARPACARRDVRARCRVARPERPATQSTYRDIQRYPPIRRDLAFIARRFDARRPTSVPRSSRREASSLGSVLLFDVFEGAAAARGHAQPRLLARLPRRGPDADRRRRPIGPWPRWSNACPATSAHRCGRLTRREVAARSR